MLPIPNKIDRKTALRYMGAAGWTPDAATTALLDEAEEKLLQTVTPRGVWRRLPLTLLQGQDIGTDLARHLNGCDEMVLMAVTLGSVGDALLRRLELTDIALGAAADAMASVLLEQTADELEAQIRQKMTENGQYLTGRYAPGYGDCPLALQQNLCLALDTVRGIGLAVTPQYLLTPRKSTTAVLGVADHPVTGTRAGCAHCLLKETCAYRRKGESCAD